MIKIDLSSNLETKLKNADSSGIEEPKVESDVDLLYDRRNSKILASTLFEFTVGTSVLLIPSYAPMSVLLRFALCSYITGRIIYNVHRTADPIEIDSEINQIRCGDEE